MDIERKSGARIPRSRIPWKPKAKRRASNQVLEERKFPQKQKPIIRSKPKPFDRPTLLKDLFSHTNEEIRQSNAWKQLETVFHAVQNKKKEIQRLNNQMRTKRQLVEKECEERNQTIRGFEAHIEQLRYENEKANKTKLELEVHAKTARDQFATLKDSLVRFVHGVRECKFGVKCIRTNDKEVTCHYYHTPEEKQCMLERQSDKQKQREERARIASLAREELDRKNRNKKIADDHVVFYKDRFMRFGAHLLNVFKELELTVYIPEELVVEIRSFCCQNQGRSLHESLRHLSQELNLQAENSSSLETSESVESEKTEEKEATALTRWKDEWKESQEEQDGYRCECGGCGLHELKLTKSRVVPIFRCQMEKGNCNKKGIHPGFTIYPLHDRNSASIIQWCQRCDKMMTKSDTEFAFKVLCTHEPRQFDTELARGYHTMSAFFLHPKCAEEWALIHTDGLLKSDRQGAMGTQTIRVRHEFKITDSKASLYLMLPHEPELCTRICTPYRSSQWDPIFLNPAFTSLYSLKLDCKNPETAPLVNCVCYSFRNCRCGTIEFNLPHIGTSPYMYVDSDSDYDDYGGYGYA